MTPPLRLDGHTVRDALGRVIVSALTPITDRERMQIIRAVNAEAKRQERAQ